MKHLLCTIIGVLSLVGAIAQNGANNFSVEASGVGRNDLQLIKVRCEMKETSEAVDTASKYAIYGMVYSGLEATEFYPRQGALVEDRDALSEDQQRWLDNFFEEGEYKQYVKSVSRNSMVISKVKKRLYRAEVMVGIDKRGLRKELENEGIIKRLGAIFY